MVRQRYLDAGPGGDPGDGDGLRLGSETCAALLPAPAAMETMTKGLGEERLSLVTPVCGPRELPAVIHAVDAALSLQWGEIVVNDWGVLAHADRAAAPALTAGRLLMRCRRGPGAGDAWEDLDDASRRYFAWGPLYDSPFLDFLRERGISRVELDPPRHWMPPPSPGELSGSLHLHTRLISVSAGCPWLYDEERGRWGQFHNCGRPCLPVDGLRMTTPALDRPLFLRGRAIIEEVETPQEEESLPAWMDRVIHDVRTGARARAHPRRQGPVAESGCGHGEPDHEV